MRDVSIQIVQMGWVARGNKIHRLYKQCLLVLFQPHASYFKWDRTTKHIPYYILASLGSSLTASSPTSRRFFSGSMPPASSRAMMTSSP